MQSRDFPDFHCASTQTRWHPRQQTFCGKRDDTKTQGLVTNQWVKYRSRGTKPKQMTHATSLMRSYVRFQALSAPWPAFVGTYPFSSEYMLQSFDSIFLKFISFFLLLRPKYSSFCFENICFYNLSFEPFFSLLEHQGSGEKVYSWFNLFF